MANPRVCEECHREAAVQIKGPVVLCRYCAGLIGPGFLNWRQVHKVWPCVVCGKRPVATVLSDDGLERPVCDEHLMAPWRIDLLLALQSAKNAITLTFRPFTRRLAPVMLRLVRWLESDE